MTAKSGNQKKKRNTQTDIPNENQKEKRQEIMRNNESRSTEETQAYGMKRRTNERIGEIHNGRKTDKATDIDN